MGSARKNTFSLLRLCGGGDGSSFVTFDGRLYRTIRTNGIVDQREKPYGIARCSVG